MSLRIPIAAAGVTLLLSTVALAQSTQTLPRGFDVVEGNSGTARPFNSSATEKWHWVYDSAQFDACYPILISRVEIRADGASTSWGPQVYQNFEMRLGASRNHYAVGSYDEVFDANWAPGTGSPHAFFWGPLSVPAGSGSGAAPNPWSISVSGPPFVYDPSRGEDFIVELRTPGSGASANPLLHDIDMQLATANPNGGNRYSNLSNANAAYWTNSGNEFVPIVNIHYVPASGLYASFSASPPSGPSPLTVTFTDDSITSGPAGVQTWAWDLDGDSVVDSNARNPRFTYSACGRYDVTLTVTDIRHPPSTKTRIDFIDVDPQLLVQPSFTWVPGGPPLSIQFTDTSTGSPAVWSWDLDGDDVPDSARQHPLWTYAAGGSYAVTLTAINACGTASVRRTVYSIGNDECRSALPLVLGLNPPATNRTATTSPAWPCSGGSDVWYSYRSTCTGTLEINACTGTSFDTALEAFRGSCSALTSIVCNDDSCGLQSRICFAVQPATSYYIRVGGYHGAQGTLQLNLILTSPGCGTFANSFLGCGGSNLATTGAPNLGAAIGFTLTPATGLPFITIGTIPVGVALCPAGCTIGHNLDVVLSGSTFQATVPSWPFLVGRQIYFQGIELGTAGGCPSGNPVQLVTSNTVRATIG